MSSTRLTIASNPSFPRRSAGRIAGCLLAMAACSPLIPSHAIADDAPLVLEDNLKVLKASKPDEKYRFVGSNAPGQLFLPKEAVTLKFSFDKGSDNGAVKDFRLELQEITTRDPDSRTKGGWTDTSGNAPLIALSGKPVSVPLTVPFTDKPTAEFEVKDVPLPEKFGTYAMVLVRGDNRQFLGSLARLPQPRTDGTVDNTPVFGEGELIGGEGQHAEYYARMGVRGWRGGGGWEGKPDGTYDFVKQDKIFAAAKKAGCKIMYTTSGSTEWTRPFGEPTPAIGWTPKTGGYGGTGDWLHRRDLDEKYGQWVEAFCRRYWDNGNGALWGIENYNEPWQGGGITGWASSQPRYREVQKVVYTNVKKVDPRIKVLAASSIMNTEDMLLSTGAGDEMLKYVDIFTDHYVAPVGCYGPMIAKAHGKGSMETETWFVNSEYALPQGVVQFLASGQSQMSPWHPRVLFDRLPGTDDKYFIPTPVVVATAAFNHMATGKPFEKMVFPEHMPYAFQFGKDDDKDALVVMLGRLMPIGANNHFKDLLWYQINSTAGGTITIDNRDGLLEFYDLAANREHQGEASVTLPLSFLPTYIKSPQGPKAVAERLKSAKIEGRRPVEIVPRDFNCLPTAKDAAVRVEVRNRLNRVLSGTLQATAPDGVTLQNASQPVTLQPGESRTVIFPVTKATVSSANAYPFRFAFASDAGDAEYKEVLNSAIVAKGAKTIDGNLDDWKDVPGVTVAGKIGNLDISEKLRRPWIEVQNDDKGAVTGEFKLAWDNDFFYIAARVNDPTNEENGFRFSERDERSYFHSAASDSRSPYKEFIEAFRTKTGDAKRSFAEVPYVYCKSPEAGIPFRRDRIHFSFDVKNGYHDMVEDTRVPAGFHAIPDTDYEYSAYWCNDGKQGNGELWRHMAPGVARIHDWPQQMRGERTTGTVPGAKIAVRRDGNVYSYEIAIPRQELVEFPFEEGRDFGFAFLIGDSNSGKVFYATDKALAKHNVLTRHPYWESGPDASPRWTLVK